MGGGPSGTLDSFGMYCLRQYSGQAGGLRSLHPRDYVPPHRLTPPLQSFSGYLGPGRAGEVGEVRKSGISGNLSNFVKFHEKPFLGGHFFGFSGVKFGVPEAPGRPWGGRKWSNFTFFPKTPENPENPRKPPNLKRKWGVRGGRNWDPGGPFRTIQRVGDTLRSCNRPDFAHAQLIYPPKPLHTAPSNRKWLISMRLALCRPQVTKRCLPRGRSVCHLILSL